MRIVFSVLLLAPLGLLACTEAPPMDARIATTERQQRSTDTWYVDCATRADVTSGILEQRALFPHDFDPGSARLTALGQHDLAILADYFKSAPGPLALVKGDASKELYAARVATVREALQGAGVDVAKVTIGDTAPGGRGVSGQDVVNAVKNDKGQFSGSSSDTGSITNQGITTGNSGMTGGNQ